MKLGVRRLAQVVIVVIVCVRGVVLGIAPVLERTARVQGPSRVPIPVRVVVLYIVMITLLVLVLALVLLPLLALVVVRYVILATC